jgi:hypothetical protein
VAAVEPPRAVHEILDHDVPVDLSASLVPWTGSATDGEPTLPVPLDTLAALYNPEAKRLTVRSVPPPPPPIARAAPAPARSSTEPPTPTGKIVPLGEAVDRQKSASIESERVRNARPRRADPITAPMKSSGDADDDLRPGHDDRASVPREPTTGRGAEPRTGRSSSRALVRETGSHSTHSEIDPVQRGPWKLIIVSVAMASIVSVTIAMVILGRGPFAPSPQSGSVMLSRARPTPRAMPVPSTAPTLANPSLRVGADSESVDTTAAPEPRAPDLPRLPIGPTYVPVSAVPATRIAPASSETGLPSAFSHPNPAPVAKPGAAPIPRAAPPGSPPPPPPLQRVGLPTPPRLKPADLAAIRAEIVRRRHRVDSLRQFVDSLGDRLPKDSSR